MIIRIEQTDFHLSFCKKKYIYTFSILIKKIFGSQNKHMLRNLKQSNLKAVSSHHRTSQNNLLKHMTKYLNLFLFCIIFKYAHLLDQLEGLKYVYSLQ